MILPFGKMGDIWHRVEICLVLATLLGEGTDVWWVEGRGADSHPTRHRTALTAENSPAQNNSGAKVEKPAPG